VRALSWSGRAPREPIPHQARFAAQWEVANMATAALNSWLTRGYPNMLGA
jgi:hypothetical protein